MTGRRGFIKAGAALGLLRAWPASAACEAPAFAVPDRLDQGPFTIVLTTDPWT